ncbi:hypothetical protein SAMN05216390_1029 [Lachnospiraceae bacterium KH1T2]|nr:hypothetical protein SAMN05216390_1029 [Lachnospiraceae bacterium KH1T2]
MLLGLLDRFSERLMADGILNQMRVIQNTSISMES